jgi:signal peptidase II
MKRFAFPASVVLALVALDLWTKDWISARFLRGELRPVIPGFLSLTLTHNKGAAFGLGQTWGTPVFVATSVVAIGVVIYLFTRLRLEERLSYWALLFILAGAIGNLVDRIRLGYVVDFILAYIRISGKTYQWPAFNVADSAITIGACLFALELLKRRKETHG